MTIGLITKVTNAGKYKIIRVPADLLEQCNIQNEVEVQIVDNKIIVLKAVDV